MGIEDEMFAQQKDQQFRESEFLAKLRARQPIGQSPLSDLRAPSKVELQSQDPLGRPTFTAPDSTGGGYVNGVYRGKDQYEQAQLFAEAYENYRQKDPRVTFSDYLDEAASKISELANGANDIRRISSRQARAHLRGITGK